MQVANSNCNKSVIFYTSLKYLRTSHLPKRSLREQRFNKVPIQIRQLEFQLTPKDLKYLFDLLLYLVNVVLFLKSQEIYI